MRGGNSRISLVVIADWLRGRLGDDEASRLTSALADQPTLSDDVEWVSRFLSVADFMPMPEPPPVLRQRLRQDFRSRFQGSMTTRRPLMIVHAIPAYDSRTESGAMIGLRGGSGDDDLVELAWHADLVDLVLDLRQARDGQTCDLDGQVLLGYDASSLVFEVRVTGPDVDLHSVDGDEAGRFRITGVPTSATRIELSNGEVMIMADLNVVGT